MVALSERKIAIVRTLVESAPDRIVGRLQEALVDSGDDSPLAGVRRLVDIEAADRRLRNAILQPIAPMCVGAGVSDRRLVFPARALACLWQGLKALAPEIIASIEAAMDEEGFEAAHGRSFDALTRLAAGALRAREQRDFAAAAELCDRARPGGASAFAACLDLAPIVRKAIARLPEWIGHAGEDTAAASRLAYKDAVAISADAGPRLFEMIAAQLSPSWMVLRVISAVMDKPTERYLADSEAGGFGERVMTDIDSALATIGKLDPDAGPEAGRSAGRLVDLIAHQTIELEACIQLSRDHGWGHRIVNQRKMLVGAVEGRLREAEKTAAAALPTEMASKQRIAPQIADAAGCAGPTRRDAGDDPARLRAGDPVQRQPCRILGAAHEGDGERRRHAGPLCRGRAGPGEGRRGAGHLHRRRLPRRGGRFLRARARREGRKPDPPPPRGRLPRRRRKSPRMTRSR